MKFYIQRREVRGFRGLGVKSRSVASASFHCGKLWPRKKYLILRTVYFSCTVCEMGYLQIFLSTLHKSRYSDLVTNGCRNHKIYVAFTRATVVDLHIERRALSAQQMSFFSLCRKTAVNQLGIYTRLISVNLGRALNILRVLLSLRFTWCCFCTLVLSFRTVVLCGRPIGNADFIRADQYNCRDSRKYKCVHCNDLSLYCYSLFFFLFI